MIKNKEIITVKEYIQKHGSDFLYILYNGHIAEYNSIQNTGVKNNINNLCFYPNRAIYKFKVQDYSKTEITLIQISYHSKGFFSQTWNKEDITITDQLNRYRYWEKVLPDGNRNRKEQ